MKILLGLMLVIIVVSCENTKKETSESNVISKDLIADASQDFKLEVYDFDGLEPLLSTTDDKTYVVNFWATWCLPCIKELPYFESLNTDYKDRDVEVILVSLDFPKDYNKKLKNFVLKRNLKSKIVALDDVDSNRWIPKVNADWSGAIPATLIFNKNKSTFYERSFNYDELQTEVKQFIN